MKAYMARHPSSASVPARDRNQTRHASPWTASTTRATQIIDEPADDEQDRVIAYAASEHQTTYKIAWMNDTHRQLAKVAVESDAHSQGDQP